MDWYKHDISDWMDGTGCLSHEAYRLYHVVVQLIYLHDGPIVNNERGIAGAANMSVRMYRKALAELTAGDGKNRPKLTIDGDRIHNFRARLELDSVAKLRESRSKAGESSAKSRKRADKPLKDNDVVSTHVKQRFNREEKSRLYNKQNRAGARVRNDGSEKDQRTGPAGGADLVDRLVEAAGGNVVHGSAQIEIAKPILDLIAEGCDLELDVLPTIARIVPELDTPLRTWAARFLRDAVLAAKANRLSGRGAKAKAREPTTEEIWDRYLTHFFVRGDWIANWGYPPDRKECSIPADYIENWKSEHAAELAEKKTG